MRNYKNNQLVRCICGNILAGYDGRSLTRRRGIQPSKYQNHLRGLRVQNRRSA